MLATERPHDTSLVIAGVNVTLVPHGNQINHGRMRRKDVRMKTFAFLLVGSALTTFVYCAGQSHFIAAEKSFQSQDYVEAHTEYAKALESKENLPKEYTLELLQKRVDQVKAQAAQEVAMKGRMAVTQKNYEEFKRYWKLAEEKYNDISPAKDFVQEAKEFHRQAVRVLAENEQNARGAGNFNTLISYNWYTSDEDRFYSRYTHVVKAIHDERLETARRLFEKENRIEVAFKTVSEALEILPYHSDTRELAERIKNRIEALRLLGQGRDELKRNNYIKAYGWLKKSYDADKTLEETAKILGEAKKKAAEQWLGLTQKACGQKRWWDCRSGIAHLQELEVEVAGFDTVLPFDKSSENFIARELVGKAEQLSERDPTLALLYLNMARSLGEKPSPLMEKRIEDQIDHLVKYKVAIAPPAMQGRDKYPQASYMLLKRLQERLSADNDLKKSIEISIADPKNKASLNKNLYNGLLDGSFLHFGIKRNVRPEARTGKYVHHQEQKPNPEYVKSHDRLVTSENERQKMFGIVQQKQATYDEAVKVVKDAKNQAEAEHQRFEQEELKCVAKPDPEKLKKLDKKMGTEISDAIRNGDDAEVATIVSKWKAANPTKDTCDLEPRKELLQVATKKLNTADEAMHKAEKELATAKQKFLEATNETFDAEIANKEVSPTITVNVMDEEEYNVAIHESKATMGIMYRLSDFMTGEEWNKSEGTTEFAEKDYASEEVGVSPPEFEYQVLEKAHEANMKDDVEITEAMIDNVVDQLYPQIKYALMLHGKRFIVAAHRAQSPNDKIRNAILALYAKNYLLNPEEDTQKMLKMISDNAGFQWKEEKMDFTRIPASLPVLSTK
jgi:hypothetical protein